MTKIDQSKIEKIMADKTAADKAEVERIGSEVEQAKVKHEHAAIAQQLDSSTAEQQMAILASWQGVYESAQAIQEVCAGHVVAEALLYGDKKTIAEDRQILELLQRRVERIKQYKLDAIARTAALSGAQA